MNATSVPFTSPMPRFMNSESRDSNLAQLDEQLKRYAAPPPALKSHLGGNVINSDQKMQQKLGGKYFYGLVAFRI